MKLLWLVPYSPYPPDNGAKLRVFNLITRLARRHEVHVVIVQSAEEADRGCAATDLGVASVTTLTPAQRKSLPGRLGQIASPMPRLVAGVTTREGFQKLQALLRQHSFDVALVEQVYMGAYLPVLRRSRVPSVLLSHNVEWKVWRDIARFKPAYNNRLTEWLEVVKLKRYEAKVARDATYRVAVSEGDRAEFEQMARARCGLSPNGVDIEAFPYRPREARGDHARWRLVMTGTMSYQPNADAAEFFLDQIAPLIRAQHPEIEVAFVGRGPSQELLARQDRDHDIHFTGYVTDVRPYVADADLFIVPLREGSGTRLKILEAMAQGIPVVTTAVGCEGLDVTHGQHVWIADTPADFATGVATLMRDATIARRLAEQARSLVEQRYDWGDIARRLEDDLATVAAH